MEIRQQFKIRKGDHLYLVPNLSTPEYLEIRTEPQWRLYEENATTREPNDQQEDFLKYAKDFFRYAMMFRERVTVDGQGRIIISQRIRDLCKLDGSIAVINMRTYAEVWNKTHMERKYSDMVRAYREINDRLF